MTTNITKVNVSEFVVTGEFDIPFSVKSDIDSEESKSGTLRFKMDSVPLGDIISSSLKDKRINWQAIARKKFEQISGSIIVVDYKGGRQPIDQKQSTKSFLESMTPEDRLKWLKEQGLV
jgi:hypothetical protein